MDRDPVRTFAIASLLLLIAPLAACNTSTTAVESAAAVPAAAEAVAAREAAEEQQAAARVLRQEPTVPQRGTYIRVLVNGEPITNFDVQRRQKFRQLRRLNASQDEAVKELIDERIKLQEARTQGMLASDAQVEQAFENFARGNNSTPSRIGGDLDRMGVGASHFKQFIRAQMSWSRTAGAKLRSETTSKTQAETMFELRKSGQAKPETTEYILQQVIFVVPDAERNRSRAQARMAEARAFRQRYQGCAGAVDLAKSLRDVAVKDLGRRLKPELPPEWASRIEKVEVGQLTEPQVTEKGVEMIGVCRSQVTSDDKAVQVVSQAQTFEALEEKGNDAAEGYLSELRKAATIVYR